MDFTASGKKTVDGSGKITDNRCAMTEIAHLLSLADAFIAATSIKEVTLSHRVFGDSKKLAAIRKGADITLGRFNAALEWFSLNWPADAEWPSEVARPAEQAA
jgi:hypothetical protein